ncbi:MAG TPA: hypothetical protein DEA57_06935 [Sulfurihydrogenibium sp.]|uniref:hypothetical protein n=1 Tax=Sulfurihydrogenibium sp. (strain YO3AOP1) TaxID=436114 RepID=UPI0001725F50|nr:hypothetical protein [Sulfurihydrogenibium sp. YO3AOP1]ACD66412.1 hypothetical protein SYO3AOP1_0779 [Sulfurihydrogenibium sp. YO3AOP1]HBT99186.1 hypothetical protein [Sulfurihydrogenibium sp.]
MRKAFLLLSIFLYAIFLLESITGYWIEKPREISALFFNLLERGDVYWLHVNILPILLYILILFHTTFTLKRYFDYKLVLTLNILIFIFLIFLHFK